MRFTYYKKSEAEQFSFIRIPKAMMTEEIFSSLSSQAKILYGMLLDRMGSAVKNKWVDEINRVYIIYPIAEIQGDMNISKGKAVSSLKELEEIGLVEKKQMGQGRPAWLYIKNFVVESA